MATRDLTVSIDIFEVSCVRFATLRGRGGQSTIERCKMEATCLFLNE
jgi:hypothetical protein